METYAATQLVLSLIALFFCYALLLALGKRKLWGLGPRMSALAALIFTSMSLSVEYVSFSEALSPLFIAAVLFLIAALFALLTIVVSYRYALSREGKRMRLLSNGAFIALMLHILLSAVALSSL